MHIKRRTSLGSFHVGRIFVLKIKVIDKIHDKSILLSQIFTGESLCEKSLEDLLGSVVR